MDDGEKWMKAMKCVEGGQGREISCIYTEKCFGSVERFKPKIVDVNLFTQH